MNYYNEHDPKAAAWLRELIAGGHIPAGIVDERSITEISPDELSEYTQCHFFAGIGGWSLALELAGWPASRPVWTGSCPCQPFSSAGEGKGASDDRHLWPVFFELIRQCRPEHVFGEQVASAIGHGWLDGVSSDLEAEGYACGATVLGAHSVGAPHIRQRLYWVAHAECGRQQEQRTPIDIQSKQQEAVFNAFSCSTDGWRKVIYAADCDEDGNCPECGIDYADCGCFGPTQDGVEYDERDGILYARWVGDGIDQGPQGHLKPGNVELHAGTQQNGSTGEAGFSSAWATAKLHRCRDGKARRIPTEPAFFPLAHGIPARVVRLRGYGNAIVPQVAAEFVMACSEILPLTIKSCHDYREKRH